MKNKLLLAALAGIGFGIVGTLGFVSLSGCEKPVAVEKPASHAEMSMTDMTRQLEGLSGDAYDKAFVEMMIAHHEGAVDMAKLSESRAKHAEVKDLSKAIIAAQEKEIADMKKWMKEWGYDTAPSTHESH